MLIPLFREEVAKEESSGDQKHRHNTNKNKGTYSPGKGCAAHPKNTRKFLSVNYHVDPSPPYPCADVPLSSTNCDDGKEEDGHVRTFERVTEFRRNCTQCEYGQRGEDASSQTDPEGSVRGKSRETWDAKILEDSVPGIEEA